MKPLLRLMQVLIISLFYVSTTIPLKAETTIADHHQHSHEHDEHAVSGLSLDQGSKWKTDAPLRQGMQSIKDAVTKVVSAFYQDTLTKANAEELAKHINEQVAYLVANCKLEPKADVTLHVLINELSQGADTLSNKSLSTDGLQRILKALALYPDYFAHSGWVRVNETGLDTHE